MLIPGDASAGITALGELFTQFSTWMGSIVTTMTSNVIFLLPLGVFCVGAAIGLAKRIIGN